MPNSFNEIAFALAGHLRRFISSPQAIFQLEFASGTRAPPPLAAAAKCLALCIKLAPGDDLMMSNMYSLLNYVAAASKEISESTSISHLMNNPLYNVDHQHLAIDTSLRGLSDDEKRAVGISTISAVTRLAIEFDNERVMV
jgi:phosphatidylinositol 4-kinase